MISDMPLVYDPLVFAKWLVEAYGESPYKSWQAVAEKVGTTRSTLSRLAGAKPQTLTGKPSQPSSDLVIKLANLFNKDMDDALIKAGHAPIRGMSEQLIDVGEGVRVSLPRLHDGKRMIRNEYDRQRFEIAFRQAYEMARQIIEAEHKRDDKGEK
jgi:transcriptional regulator with XRE-family HTH domain